MSILEGGISCLKGYLLLRKRYREEPKYDELLSLTKLKTLEYRLFRNMREKLRNYVNGVTQNDPDRLKTRYVRECKDLSEGIELPHSLDYYTRIFLHGIDLVDSRDKQERIYFEDLLFTQYVHFLEEVILDMNKNKIRNPEVVSFDSLILNKQTAIKYDGYLGAREKPSIKEQPKVFTKKVEKVVVPVEIKAVSTVTTTPYITAPAQQNHTSLTLANTIVLIVPPCTLDV